MHLPYKRALWSCLAPLLLGCSPTRHVAPSEPRTTANGAGQSIFGLFEPNCPGQPSLSLELATFRTLLESALEPTGSSLHLVNASGLRSVLQQTQRGFLAAVLMGHGDERAATSALCTSVSPETLFIDDLSKALPVGISGAVFIANACHSANVDPRVASAPVSVISASPFAVRTDSLFGEVLADAFIEASADPNCDGLVTDQELYDAIVSQLTQRMSVSGRPAFPKLRRNAPSHIPLPILPKLDGHCAGALSEMNDLVDREGGAWGGLGTALRVQIGLRAAVESSQSTALPSADHDYFFVERAADPKVADWITQLARSEGLVELSSTAIRDATRIARFAIFAEIYALSERCGWVTIRRLRDDRVVAVSRRAELGAAVPRRDGLEWPRNGVGDPVRRRTGRWKFDAQELSTPCYSGVGQCFKLPSVGSISMQESPSR